MPSPQPKEADISSKCIVVSETDGAAKLHKPDMMMRRRRRTEAHQSPFKVPDSNAILLQSFDKKESQKEEMRTFLSLPIEEKTSHAARMKANVKRELGEEAEEEEEEEENEKMRNWEQTKGRVVLPEQTAARRELKMAMMKRENMTKESKQDLIYMERQKAVLELSLMTKRSEISKMDKAVVKEEGQLKRLERAIERDNLKFEEFLRENEKKSVEARTFYEQEAKSKQQKIAEIKKLTAEMGTISSELVKFEEILLDYNRYKDLLFKLSPPEWQEAQKTKTVKAKVLSDAQDPVEAAGLEVEVSSPGRELPAIREASDTLITSSKLDSDRSEYEDEPELYFTEPQQLQDLVTELAEQNLSLIRNSARVEETLEELKKSMEITRKKIDKDEEQLTLQLNDMSQRIQAEKARGGKLQKKVQLHFSLKTEDQDAMLEALGAKVAEVYQCCTSDRMTNLSTLEKLVNIESHMSLLLQGLESIPEESLEMMKRIKDREKRSREREEKLREQKLKQQERMRRYLERSLTDSKKLSGRKLMPRSMPVAQKVKVSNVDNGPTEDDFHAHLFTSDDME